MKASEVLEASIKDIEAGKWICGELEIKDAKGPNPKEMACAVGLVSLNSGDTKKIRITKKDLPHFIRDDYYSEKYIEEIKQTGFEVNIIRDSGASCSIEAHDIKVGDVFEVARYPKKSSPEYTKQAIEYLFTTMPEDAKAYKCWSKSSLDRKVGAVVNYNDEEITGQPKKALKWFKAAAEAARKDGN